MHRPAVSLLASMAAALALTALAQPIHAADQLNATGACKSALPVYDGNIRSRPLGVRNEGNSNAFVSCSMPSEHNSRLRSAALRMHNGNAVATSITCTFVNGRFGFSPQSETKTIDLGAGVSGWLIFYTGATAPSGGDLANFSCNLKPGTEISFLETIPATP